MSVTLDLGPNGQLLATIPHERGDTHLLLPLGKELPILYSILHAQAAGVRKVTGTAACPTQWDVDRWGQIATLVKHIPPRSRKITYNLTLEDLGL